MEIKKVTVKRIITWKVFGRTIIFKIPVSLNYLKKQDKPGWNMCFNCKQKPIANAHTGLCKQCYVYWNSGKINKIDNDTI